MQTMHTSGPALCPCGSSRTYSECCGLVHGGQPAANPEALMRSRYSAFAQGLSDYLLESWHSTTRPPLIEPSPQTLWKQLQVIGSGEDGDQGWVHFRATFVEQGRWACLEEKSNFRREDGHWRYLDGTPRIQELHPERNAPCPCGSGRKFKKCCLD